MIVPNGQPVIEYLGYHRDTSIQYDGPDSVTRMAFVQIREWMKHNTVMYNRYPGKKKVTTMEHVTVRSFSDSDSEATGPFEDDIYDSDDGDTLE